MATNPIELWFTLVGGALLKMIVPGALALGAYWLICRRYKWTMNQRIVYYILSVVFLISMLSSITEIWNTPAVRRR